jgi:tetratricopeptide (TPR) repeat protein
MREAWSADNVTAAAAHYKQGRKLYQVGEYARALEEFKQAYLAKEDAAFLFNIAQCHRQLGATREAITFYRRYIKEAPAEVPNRAEAEKLVKDLEATLAQQPAAGPPPPEAAPAPAYPPPAPAYYASPPPGAAPAPPRRRRRRGSGSAPHRISPGDRHRRRRHA